MIDMIRNRGNPWKPSHSWRVTRGNVSQVKSSPSDPRVNSWTALKLTGNGNLPHGR